MSAQSAPSSDRHPSRPGPSYFAPDLAVTGRIATSGDLEIDGQVDGTVDAQRLKVGPHGRVRASLGAEDAVISGNVVGVLKARGVTFTDGCHFNGEVQYEQVGMEPAAVVEGLLHPVIDGNARTDVGQTVQTAPAVADRSKSEARKRERKAAARPVPDIPRHTAAVEPAPPSGHPWLKGLAVTAILIAAAVVGALYISPAARDWRAALVESVRDGKPAEGGATGAAVGGPVTMPQPELAAPSGPEPAAEPEPAPAPEPAPTPARTVAPAAPPKPEPPPAPAAAEQPPRQAPDPVKPEPVKTTPGNAEGARPEPAKQEPAPASAERATPPKAVIPAAPKPAAGEPAAGEPAAGEPAAGVPADAAPPQARPAKPAPAKSEPVKPEPAKSEPVKAEPAKPVPAAEAPPKASAPQPVPPAPKAAKPAPQAKTEPLAAPVAPPEASPPPAVKPEVKAPPPSSTPAAPATVRGTKPEDDGCQWVKQCAPEDPERCVSVRRCDR